MYSQEAQKIIDDLEYAFCVQGDQPSTVPGYSYPENFFVPIYYDSIKSAVTGLSRNGKTDSAWVDGISAIADILKCGAVSSNKDIRNSVYEVVAEGLRRFYYIFRQRAVGFSEINRMLHPNAGALTSAGASTFSRCMDSGNVTGREIGDRIRRSFGLDPEMVINDVSLMLETTRELMNSPDPKTQISGVREMTAIYRNFGAAKLIQKMLDAGNSNDSNNASSPVLLNQPQMKTLRSGGINDPKVRAAMSAGSIDSKQVVAIKSGGSVKPIEADFEEVSGVG